jgi:hypothetical protein
VGRGQVLFLSHEPTAALLNGFYNRCCPRALFLIRRYPKGREDAEPATVTLNGTTP